MRFLALASLLALGSCGEGREVDDAPAEAPAAADNVIDPVSDPVAQGVPAPQYAPGA